MNKILNTISTVLVIATVVESYTLIHPLQSNVESYVQYGNKLKHRARRDAVLATTCGKDILDEEAKNKIKKNQFPLKDDKNYDLQLVWLGENAQTLFLLTTTDLRFFLFYSHAPSILYQSDDFGFSFENVQKKIGETEIRSSYGIMKSPLNSNKLIFISYTSTSMGFFGSFFSRKENNTFLLITEDGGKTFNTVEIPFVARENEPLLFHPTDENTIIALERKKKIMRLGEGKTEKFGFAWISNDFGKTWHAMMKGHIAETVKWGAAKGKEGKEIYISTEISSSVPFSSIFSSSAKLTLWKSSDGGKFFEEIVQECYNFGIQGDFVFASVEFNDTSDNEEKRIMHVSKDSGNTFNPVHVPEITPERFYAVVEMYNGTIFLHVDEAGDTGKGTLYTSGADGLMYTKSLGRHFYTNSGFNDFVRIESMEGVYMTQVLAQDLTLTSMITFNRGMSWQPLYTPNHCANATGSCSLHYHSQYSKQKRVPMQPPLSSPNAPGIVFVHGNVGDGLVGTTAVWLSTNGGYNWTKVANGPHHYAIGDRGNLLVIVPMLNTTGNTLKYSIDQGRCWNEYKFTDSNDKITIRGVVTEPHSQERVFSLWGYLTDSPKEKKEWIVITVNFHKMFSKQCDVEDLEEFYPHSLNGKGGCLLGKIIVYRRPKLDATCFLGKSFQPFAKEEICTCSKDDIECDYGYDRTSSGTCEQNKDIKPIEVCEKGKLEKEGFSKGYRRVPGDVCSSNSATDDMVKFIDEKGKCVPSLVNMEGIEKMKKKEEEILEKQRQEKLKNIQQRKEEEREEKENHDEIDKTTKVRKIENKKKSHALPIILVVVIAFGIVIGVVFYIRKYGRRDNYKATYTLSKLNKEDDDMEEAIFDARPKSQRPYKDESDVEDDIMLPV